MKRLRIALSTSVLRAMNEGTKRKQALPGRGGRRQRSSEVRAPTHFQMTFLNIQVIRVQCQFARTEERAVRK